MGSTDVARVAQAWYIPDNAVFTCYECAMKHPLESLLAAGGILLLALLSCLLLPAPALSMELAQTLISRFRLLDLNQLYTIIFCLWFLLLGVIEYLVIRFVWKRWFSLS